ncbi:MAG TPA: SLC13 family permease, partial [Geminicoccaceae bacterium]|nr:SLC13 family permease [Geminicoccaceae bacterium]
AAVPVHLTALLVFTLAALLQVAPPDVVFSGFVSAAFWLIFGGLVLGAGVRRTGLARRLALAVGRHLTGSYRRAVFGCVGLGVVLAVLVPSAMGRMVILIPVVQAFARSLGFQPGRRGYVGLITAAAYGTFMAGFAVLPSNLPNLVLMGAAETLYGFEPVYGTWLMLHFPVLGLLKALLVGELVCRLYPDEPRPGAAEEDETLGPWSAEERRLAVILLTALVAWATDFLHGVSPGWVALAAGTLCLLPRVGVIGPAAFESDLDLGTLLYVAGVLGIVSLIDATGLGAALGEGLLGLVPLEPGAPATGYAALVGVSTVIGAVASLPAIPGILTPLAGQIAAASGLPLVTVLMVQMVGASALLLPYQSAPLVVALRLGDVRLPEVVGFSLLLAALTLLVLAPVNYLWWSWLGYFG